MIPNLRPIGRRAFAAGAAGAATFAAADARAQLLEGLFNAIPGIVQGLSLGEADELRMADELYRPLLARSGGVYANRAVQEAIRRFAEPLFRTSKRAAFVWEAAIVDDNTVNAWAMPAGKIAINKGLLRYVDSETELAAVLAHEIGHAELSHQIEAMRSQAFNRGLGQGARAALVSRAGAGGLAAGVALDALAEPLHDLVTSGYSRDAERAADRHILAVFQSTGHDPAKASAFFRTLLQLIPKDAAGTTSLFSTHPGTIERIDNIDRAAAAIRGRGAAASADFRTLKEAFPTRRVYRRNV